ncbi:type 4a pilus biogenesis protein PilO [Deinococcus deserti]|uniref:Putative Type IV pilus assembly protein PilO n=1 Tax=Deinococcus deserti (strain DSM 17065 / CIP 109153 / LMG 22923 / VCD115) TaxID=546414 RepID=C1CX19_DEIDV|nr:type 4a pilus biogenesis protein PilO [Deinococcus deserti]ACO46736.1 putative Type IV pilus assembly protein PilO precursor [Deinococcus deserti VCD115]
MFSKLAPRNLFVLMLGLALAVIAMWYTFRFQPRQQEISLLRADLDTAQTRVAQLRSAAAQLPELRKTVERLKVEQAEFVRALPQTANFGTVLDEVRRTTAATGADMSTFSVQSGNTAGLPAGVRPIGLNLSVSGTFAELFQTLRALETMGRFTNVNTIALQLPQADSFNPNLESTMALTVYTFDPAQATPGAAGDTPGAPPAAPAAPASPPAGGTSGGTQ